MNLSAEQRIDVLNAFMHLQECLKGLELALLSDEGMTAWMQPPPKLLHVPVDATFRQTAYQVISQLEYVENQAPREILVCAGFIGASDETLERARLLNEAKDEFKETILSLKRAKISIKDEALNKAFNSALKSRSDATASTLKKMGLARLHLKQCYRKIPILPATPLKISWTWAHTRSIKRISVDEAQYMLMKKTQDAGIVNQLSLLSQLPNDETLAIVQELAPHLRANILLPENDDEKTRVMVKGPIPIFFPANATSQTPKFKPPGEKSFKNESRLTRKDARLDPKPFLPAIRAHRYIFDEEDVLV